ncbi:MAG: electron transfer flavoprotein-ubiquinone oxidoreductase [Alphaproteobacteria bacterium]|nr:electron transfer flavoprotein-ubiquinone oxidoreductase [Alphaproteobacteria bacterium]NDC56325.1 electron transfer flavoprotein-ubiquinone oxidoreductase [Alphaproteobacteria bacterium]
MRADRETMSYDVLIVGGGPAGLATAIRLKQLRPETSVCLIDKGSEIGAHLLSGAVLEPRALDELFPAWRTSDAPVTTAVARDSFYFLTAQHAFRLPTPPTMHNHGNYIISLVQLAKWLAKQADDVGVEIYAGFSAAELLCDDSGKILGVATGDAGIGKHGQKTDRFTPGVELRATYTVFAEGCRGSLTRQLFDRFKLRDHCQPQTYGLGLKEVWEIDPKKFSAGAVMHTIGWPMDCQTYGGAWVYHWEKSLISLGFVVGLDYANPYLSPYEEFQRFKHHPLIKHVLEGGKRVAYGARALSEGGYQAIPQLAFPGGLIVGDAAGFLNMPKIKGNHTAMKSGMVAAEALAECLNTDAPPVASAYAQKLRASWLWDELYTARNVRPGFYGGLVPGLLNAAVDQYLFRGRAPWTLRLHADHETLGAAKNYRPIAYPKPDGVYSFDRLTSVQLTGTMHAEDQPAHLTLRDPSLAISVNNKIYDSPETRYCPAGVYELIQENGHPKFVINAQNCIHCKTCDIKDPRQNIVWVTPEGSGGPNYQLL